MHQSVFCYSLIKIKKYIYTVLLIKEEQRLSMFEDTAMRKIFEPKWVEVRGGWRTLHISELYHL
jgi:hypothetical protein